MSRVTSRQFRIQSLVFLPEFRASSGVVKITDDPLAATCVIIDLEGHVIKSPDIARGAKREDGIKMQRFSSERSRFFFLVFEQFLNLHTANGQLPNALRSSSNSLIKTMYISKFRNQRPHSAPRETSGAVMRTRRQCGFANRLTSNLR